MLCLGYACGTVTWFRLCGLPCKATIEWIEAADYYTGLHVGDRTLMLRESITDLAAKLDPATFRRVHRSAIVKMNYVAEIYREGLDEGTVVLLNGQRLKMSKTGRFKLTRLARLSQLSEVGQEVDKGSGSPENIGQTGLSRGSNEKCMAIHRAFASLGQMHSRRVLDAAESCVVGRAADFALATFRCNVSNTATCRGKNRLAEHA